MSIQKLIDHCRSHAEVENAPYGPTFIAMKTVEILTLCEVAEKLYQALQKECYRRMPCNACDTIEELNKFAALNVYEASRE